RILTAIKASQSGKWGDIQYRDWQRWSCEGTFPNAWEGRLTLQAAGTKISVPAWDPERRRFVEVECVAEYAFTESAGNLDIIVARSDDYPDALAAAPLADVLDAPILLNPSGALNSDVRAEIARLAREAGGRSHVTVHLLGGTDALSHDVENAIDGIPNVDTTLRYQGIDRFQTAVNIAGVTVGYYGIESEAGTRDINSYLTTGRNFPDALSAGAAAAENDGVVLLTDGDKPDRRGFTEDFLINLRTWVNDDVHLNTTENFAVGGPSAKAAADYDIRLAAAYVGADRYETATKTATATFSDPEYMAIVSGENFADALVGSGFIANADGPLLLTRNAGLSPVTADYLKKNVDDGDTIVVFGGGNSVSRQVSADVQALLDELFELPEW
ncbi:MAG: hypothetical protein GXX86_00875, partial [Propionibacterium sp.]|nr:hypothetical protein [Propionibacterium sp.]